MTRAFGIGRFRTVSVRSFHPVSVRSFRVVTVRSFHVVTVRVMVRSCISYQVAELPGSGVRVAGWYYSFIIIEVIQACFPELEV